SRTCGDLMQEENSERPGKSKTGTREAKAACLLSFGDFALIACHDYTLPCKMPQCAEETRQSRLGRVHRAGFTTPHDAKPGRTRGRARHQATDGERVGDRALPAARRLRHSPRHNR